MENRFLKSLIIGVFSLTSCISQENPPEVKTPDQTKFITETVVDGIDIPWGMDFIKIQTYRSRYLLYQSEKKNNRKVR